MSVHVNDEHVIELDDPRAGRALVAEPPAPPKPQPVAPPVKQAAVTASGAPVPTRSLIKQLEARLKVVNREIKARANLEAERGQITRLIAAAKLEKNNVRRLRDVG